MKYKLNPPFKTLLLIYHNFYFSRYAMALYNQHVCPVDNWMYNQSCEVDLPMQRGPTLCCTLENVPLISKCGTLPPESCFFSLICSTGSFMVMVIVLLRYAHVIEKHQNCVLNTASLSTGWICAAGLIMVGNFQSYHDLTGRRGGNEHVARTPHLHLISRPAYPSEAFHRCGVG
ncbi:Transmembrane protein 150A [Anabarilius grahami]|uniref:Transmembrane protein 150A n=1 Tax=Anabarilius grahami TaxID=495550 RepID=A0A3N0XXF3_ANAGA|nr:Transmembrane protein 150A [Anabarilius grahami]